MDIKIELDDRDGYYYVKERVSGLLSMFNKELAIGC